MAAYGGVATAFSSGASGYDKDRSKLIPHFEILYEAALDIIRDWHCPPSPRVMDIGAGTGLMARMVLEVLPDASILLLDGSDKMLGKAQEHFPSESSVSFQVGDMSTADLGEGWNLIVSSLAIHHLENDDKRRLFARIRQALVPGGLFINVEQVLGPDAKSDDRYNRFWKRDIAKNGASEAQVQAAAERMSFDRCASVEDQLRWMREAGFKTVDCSVKAWRFAVLSAEA